MLIKIFCDFCKSDDIMKHYEQMCISNEIEFYGPDKEIYFTAEDNYTHAIILNCAMPSLTIPKENVIGFAHEPVPFLNLSIEFVEYAKQFIGKYYIGDRFTDELPDLFIEHYGFVGYSLPQQINTTKNKIMSIIVSKKMMSSGHIYRHSLVSKILLNNLPIDVYGNGSHIYNGNNIKGNFEKNEPYTDYLFTVAIENFESNHYFSEKIASPIMNSCMPIYLGCKNIGKYLENCIILSGNINNDLMVLQELLINPMKYYKNPLTENNMNNVNLIKNIKSLF